MFRIKSDSPPGILNRVGRIVLSRKFSAVINVTTAVITLVIACKTASKAFKQ